METQLVTLVSWLILELVASISSKTPLWLTQQCGKAFVRLWKNTIYLRNLLLKEKFSQWDGQKQRYIFLQTISNKARKNQIILHILSSLVSKNQQAIVVGKPGAGKTATLEVLLFRLAKYAYQYHLAIWFFLIFPSLMLLLIHPAYSVIWVYCFLFGFPFLSRVHVPIFIEARSYDGQLIGEWLDKIEKKYIGDRPTLGQFKQVTFLIDGVNEIQGSLFEKFIEGWREILQDFHPPSIVFTSRINEDPSSRMGLKNTFSINELEDIEIKAFIESYKGGRSFITPTEIDAQLQTLKVEGLLAKNGFGRNPFCLKMIIESGKYTQKQALLLTSYVEQLIKREINEKPEAYKRTPEWKNVPINFEIEMLSNLALYMHQTQSLAINSDTWQMMESTMTKFLKDSLFSTNDVFAEGEYSNLLLINYHESLGFSHQLLQDFFASNGLRHRRNWKYMDGVHNISWWYQTLLFTSELLYAESSLDYDDFIAHLLGNGDNSQRLFITLGIIAQNNRMPSKILEGVENKFIQILNSEQPNLIYESMSELHKLYGDKAKRLAIGILATLIDKHEQIKDILIHFGDTSAEFVMQKYLSAISENSKETLSLLLQMGDPALLLLLANCDRLQAQKIKDVIDAMGNIEGSLALEVLFQILIGGDFTKGNFTVTGYVSQTIIQKHSTSLNYYSFLNYLEHPNDRLRWISAYALGVIGNTDAIPYLAEHAENDNGFFHILDYPFGGVPKGRVKKAAQDAINMIRAQSQKNVKKEYKVVIVEYKSIGEFLLEIK